MKFSNISIRNFMAIGTADVQLADRGLVLIQGESDEAGAVSNGAGKSSLMDALCWVLYGETARGLSGDAVVNATAKKDCRVSVSVVDADDTYCITRCRKHSTGKNLLAIKMQATTGGETDLTKGTEKETQKVIERIIGCPYEVFRAAVYAGQESFPDLPAMTDKQLKILVEQAAGIELLERAYEIARARHAQHRIEVLTSQRSLDDAIDKLAHYEADAALIAEQDKEWIKNHSFKRAELAVKLLSSRNQLSIYANDLAERTVRGETEEELDAAISAAKDKRRFLIEAETKEQKKLYENVTHANANVALAYKETKRLVDVARRESDALKNIESRIGEPCGECGKEYCEEDIGAARDLQKKLVERALINLRNSKIELAASESALESAQKRLDDHRASLTDTSAIDAEIASLEDKRSDLINLKRQHDNEVAVVKAREADADAHDREKNPLKAMMERAEKTIVDTKAKIDDLKLKLAADDERLRVLDAVMKTYSPAGVRAHILDTVTPFLNDRTARYLSTLSDGVLNATWSTITLTAKGDAREKFQIAATGPSADGFAALSGGEKRKVRIACALALQELVASRASKPIELFIGDEIDDALDVAGLERLMTVLDVKARERGSLFVISHNSLRDWIDNVITVRKIEGVATVIDEAA